MAKNKDAERYGAEIGAGIKKGLQGLNTNCSPKKRKTCIRLIVIPLLMFAVGGIMSMVGDSVTALAGFFMLGVFCLGLYQFYVGRIGKGILYTVTFGGFFIGCMIDLFKLTVTRTFKDVNGFPVIY